MLDLVRDDGAFAGTADCLGILRGQVLVVLRIEQVQELSWLDIAHFLRDLILSRAVRPVLLTQWSVQAASVLMTCYLPFLVRTLGLILGRCIMTVVMDDLNKLVGMSEFIGRLMVVR